jgi:hypothetical protein
MTREAHEAEKAEGLRQMHQVGMDVSKKRKRETHFTPINNSLCLCNMAGIETHRSKQQK